MALLVLGECLVKQNMRECAFMSRSKKRGRWSKEVPIIIIKSESAFRRHHGIQIKPVRMFHRT